MLRGRAVVKPFSIAILLSLVALGCWPVLAERPRRSADAPKLLERQRCFFGITLLRHEPKNVSVEQMSHDGTQIPWAGTAKTNRVVLRVGGDPDPSPNICPPRGIVEFEIREGHEQFTYQPNILSPVAGCLPNDCSRLVGATAVTLQPKTAYKWQARLVAIYDWMECTKLRLPLHRRGEQVARILGRDWPPRARLFLILYAVG
ncbi:hypothetical protein ACVWWI_006750 [Bradyrhizobium sp. USDA 3686]|nr:hypothetical protein [Bradyrhizobium canariense]